jgi:hypothetical protein
MLQLNMESKQQTLQCQALSATEVIFRGQDSSVGIGMAYRLNGPCSVPSSGKIFFSSLGLIQPSTQWVPGDFPGG